MSWKKHVLAGLIAVGLAGVELDAWLAVGRLGGE